MFLCSFFTSRRLEIPLKFSMFCERAIDYCRLMKHENVIHVANEGYNKPVALRNVAPLMESSENSVCKCTRSLLSFCSSFPLTSAPNEAAFCSCSGQHWTILGKREISLLAENAYMSAGASRTFIIVNEYFMSVTLTSKPWCGDSPQVSRNIFIFFLVEKLVLIFE